MYASIRRHRLERGEVSDVMQRLDEGFARKIAVRPGFCSYEVIDCGGGEITTVSVFLDAEQAEESRTIAMRWTEEELADVELNRIEALHGLVAVNRASRDGLGAVRVDDPHEFASIRRYAIAPGQRQKLMHRIDVGLADRIAELPGFVGYHVVDCENELVAICSFRDKDRAAESDGVAQAFVRDELAGFQIERTEVAAGVVRVKRSRVGRMSEPAHA